MPIGNFLSRAKGLVSPRTATTALSRTMELMQNSPRITGALIGGAAGYAAGDGTGGVIGGITGGILGKKAFSGYKMGAAANKTFSGRVGSRIGKGLSKLMPNVASSLSPDSLPGIQYMTRGGGMMMEGGRWYSKGARRNIGGKMMGSHIMGIGKTLAGGAIAGMGANMAFSLAGGAGKTFGSQTSQLYGNAFSGMGNGTISGY